MQALSKATWIARVAGAVLLGWTAFIHFRLYHHYGYNDIPHIGKLFILNMVVGIVLAVAILATPRPWVALVAIAGSGFELVTFLSLVKAMHGGIFGFTEQSSAPLLHETYTVELLGFVILGAFGLALLNQWRLARVKVA